MVIPLSVIIDSGWNCIPYVACSLCFSPIICPSASSEIIFRHSGSELFSTISEWYLATGIEEGSPAKRGLAVSIFTSVCLP